MRLTVAIIIVVFTFSTYADDDSFKPKNYCKDKKAWAEWEVLVAKYPDDDDVQILHAMRVGLCIKVEQGSISLEKAVELFDRAHEFVIKQTEMNKKKKPAL